MTETGCFPYTSNRVGNQLENRGKTFTKNYAGLMGCTETSKMGFSDTPRKSLMLQFRTNRYFGPRSPLQWFTMTAPLVLLPQTTQL
jgi:hypothetical protein